MGDAEFTSLWRIRKTVHQMLRDRKYVVSQEELTRSKDSFKENFSPPEGSLFAREQLTVLTHKLDDPDDLIFVFFPDEEKVGVKRIKEYAQRMKDEKVSRAIIVVRQHMTPFARQSLLETERTKFHMEQFLEQELLVNITEHVLVPKHVLLDELEKKQLLERYKVKEGQLPRIQLHDPVARYYGLKRGMVVRIIRPSETAGRYVTYRLCV